jgi:hypothetical protein
MPNAVLDNKKSGCGATLFDNMRFVKQFFGIAICILMRNGKYHTG